MTRILLALALLSLACSDPTPADLHAAALDAYAQSLTLGLLHDADAVPR